MFRKKKKRSAGKNQPDFHADLEMAISDLPDSQLVDGDHPGNTNGVPVGTAGSDKVVDSEDKSSEEKLRESERQFLKDEIHRQVINKIDLNSIGKMRDEDLRLEIRRNAEFILEESADFLDAEQRAEVIEEVIDETFGLGPLEPLFKDDSVTDVMINGAKHVYVERNGRLELSHVKFADDAHVIRIVQRIVGAVGRRVDGKPAQWLMDGWLTEVGSMQLYLPWLWMDR